MIFQIASDLHLEAYADSKFVWNFLTPLADTIIIAGDLDARKFEESATEIASRYKKVIIVPGNHDFYHKNIRWKPDMKKIPANVSVLHRDTVEYEGVTFIGATLWSDMKNHDWFVVHAADKKINDFYMIQDKKVDDDYGMQINRFTSHAATVLHAKEKAYIEKMIELNRGKKIVVVTHFVPSYALIHPRWKTMSTEMLNSYFSANCDDLIVKSEAAAWVFGHTHDPRDMMIGDVRCICNPYGYPSERNNYENLVIEI